MADHPTIIIPWKGLITNLVSFWELKRRLPWTDALRKRFLKPDGFRSNPKNFRAPIHLFDPDKAIRIWYSPECEKARVAAERKLLGYSE
jgi:hypothetical protein